MILWTQKICFPNLKNIHKGNFFDKKQNFSKKSFSLCVQNYVAHENHLKISSKEQSLKLEGIVNSQGIVN